VKIRELFLVGYCLGLSANALPALEWTEGKGFRSAELKVPAGGKSGFTLLAPGVTGITFTNLLPEERYRTNAMLLNGSGVACGDVDGDGWCDLYFCRLGGPNVLYKNLGGWKFQDVTASAGVACSNMDCTGAAFADLNGDGHLDLVVNSLGHGTHIFLNDGKGHFTELATVAPLNPNKGGTSLALGDLDGDGYLDLYIANYRTSALVDMPQTRFMFKKVDGRQVISTVNGRPVTEPDLIDRFTVNENGGIDEQGEVDVLYRNQGGTNFLPISFIGGAFLDEDGKSLSTLPFDWGLSVMIRDLNHDGLPDIYVCNDFDSPERIWINQAGATNGHLSFRAIPRLALRKTSLFSMGVDVADINRDGFDDIFVLDMLSRDHRRRMNFMPDRKLPVPRVGEIENRPQYSRNSLSLNRGDGTYAEMASAAGLSASEWSWCPIFLDVDLDGWEDVLITNGFERDSRNMDVAERLKAMRAAKAMSNAEILEARKLFPRLATSNCAFQNRRDLTFEDRSQEWGFDFAGVSHGMALADLDNDGDLDVVVNNMNGLAGIYRNETSAPRVAVKLKGQAPNTGGIGARIEVRGGPVVQSQEIICGGRYLSCDAAERTFAAGTLTNDLTIEVTWRSGSRSVIEGVRPNRVYEVVEEKSVVSSPLSVASTEAAHGQANTQHATGNTPPPPLFEDLSYLLHHVHEDEPFDDYARQPLLPRKLSQLGPGVSWYDLDGDGWDDLIIASGKGGHVAVFRNNAHGGFSRWEGPPMNQPVTRDQTTVLGIRLAGGNVLLAGSANYEDGMAVGSCVRQYDIESKKVEDRLPGQVSSTGPLALADLDGDGNLDLFVGGRCLPGKYPQSASSMVFRRVGGTFEVDAPNTKALAGVGLVSAAVFSDLDGDGFPELILACEWGPVRVFRNDHGKLVPWNPGVTFPDAVTARHGEAETRNLEYSTLNQLTGWWNGVTTGDFDGDGKLDIVVSNWGRNTRYESHRGQPLQVLYGDFNENGPVAVIEAYYEPSMKKWVPERSLDFMARALPFLREKFQTHEAFGAASVEEIFGDRFKTLQKAEANWLESTVFMNRGDHFEIRPLPMEAQLAPAFGVCVADFDGDGLEDIFLSQNFFSSQPETPRSDAGRGLMLRGKGHGKFTALAGQGSGVKVYGEQRGCASADFDGDGRVDLVVAQNGTATKLYHNIGAKPGLRVRLDGSQGNPNGVGASLRLGSTGHFGPVREVHAGSGYWSQDSAVQVMNAAEPLTQLWVRWPGGKEQTLSIPAGSQEIVVGPSGKIDASRH